MAVECRDCGALKSEGYGHREWCGSETFRKLREQAWAEGYGAGCHDMRNALDLGTEYGPARVNPYSEDKMWHDYDD